MIGYHKIIFITLVIITTIGIIVIINSEKNSNETFREASPFLCSTCTDILPQTFVNYLKNGQKCSLSPGGQILKIPGFSYYYRNQAPSPNTTLTGSEWLNILHRTNVQPSKLNIVQDGITDLYTSIPEVGQNITPFNLITGLIETYVRIDNGQICYLVNNGAYLIWDDYATIYKNNATSGNSCVGTWVFLNLSTPIITIAAVANVTGLYSVTYTLTVSTGQNSDFIFYIATGSLITSKYKRDNDRLLYLTTSSQLLLNYPSNQINLYTPNQTIQPGKDIDSVTWTCVSGYSSCTKDPLIFFNIGFNFFAGGIAGIPHNVTPSFYFAEENDILAEFLFLSLSPNTNTYAQKTGYIMNGNNDISQPIFIMSTDGNQYSMKTRTPALAMNLPEISGTWTDSSQKSWTVSLVQPITQTMATQSKAYRFASPNQLSFFAIDKSAIIEKVIFLHNGQPTQTGYFMYGYNILYDDGYSMWTCNTFTSNITYPLTYEALINNAGDPSQGYPTQWQTNEGIIYIAKDTYLGGLPGLFNVYVVNEHNNYPLISGVVSTFISLELYIEPSTYNVFVITAFVINKGNNIIWNDWNNGRCTVYTRPTSSPMITTDDITGDWCNDNGNGNKTKITGQLYLHAWFKKQHGLNVYINTHDGNQLININECLAVFRADNGSCTNGASNTPPAKLFFLVNNGNSLFYMQDQTTAIFFNRVNSLKPTDDPTDLSIGYTTGTNWINSVTSGNPGVQITLPQGNINYFSVYVGTPPTCFFLGSIYVPH